MGRKRTPGLRKRGKVWHIEKQVRGFGPLHESTGTGDLVEAEAHLARRLEQIRQATVFGVRPKRTFRQAATKYLEETEKRSLARDAQDLRSVEPWIGDLPLDQVHMGTLRSFIEARQAQGVSAGTINRTLSVVRRILNLAGRLWRDECGLSWLEVPPLIQMVAGPKREGHPLSLEEQARLLAELPRHLSEMAVFGVNTGCRDGEICGLRWEWLREREGVQYFDLPESITKTATKRPVVLNSAARAIVEARRGIHPVYVFTYRPRGGVERPIVKGMLNNGWRRARNAAGLPDVTVHDLRRTAASRWRDAGVPEWTVADLLGHRRGSVTRLYAMPTLRGLAEAAETIVPGTPGLVVLRGAIS